MLHELLLALVGCTGDVFVDIEEEGQTLAFLPHYDQDDGNPSSKCTFTVAPDCTFLRPSERELLQKLLRLGFHYRELERFAIKSRNLSWLNVSNSPGAIPSKLDNQQSVYQRALANGIVEVLQIYRSAVLKVEQNVLSDPLPVLASVTKGLYQFESLLQPLHSLICEVEKKKLRGGPLLSLLHEKCHCGVPELQSCMQRLLWHDHQVMYRQLSAWMIYGLLQDEHQEFFISRSQDGGSSVTSSELDKSRVAEDSSLTDWHTGFCVHLDMLPEYIPIQVAESILFVGKAVRVLRNPSKSFRSQALDCHRLDSKTSQKTEGSGGDAPFAKFYVLSNGCYQGPELLPQGEADKIASLLQELKERSLFHKLSFEHAIDSIRTIAATHLWQLVVVHADLIGHLKALKDYFLLAKGDFFQCFLEESRSLMRLPPRPSTAEADLKVPFQQAASKTIGDDDKYFSRVCLRMPSMSNASGVALSEEAGKQRKDGNTYSEGGAVPPYGGWDGITLEYSIDWPLQLLFTREILAKYSRVFQYLLRLKRIQLELEKSWAEAMHHDRADCIKQRNDINNTGRQRRQQRVPMWRLRQHMAYLITNLQFYIQVDVIESQWNLLQERVQVSKDFTELARFHQEYLSALISQSFLDIGSVSRILDSIIKLCLQHCRLMEQQDGASNTAELEQISEEFKKKSNSLYTILRSSKLAGSQRAPFLRQFLLRLNYNSFFEATARGALNAIRPRPTLIH